MKKQSKDVKRLGLRSLTVRQLGEALGGRMKQPSQITLGTECFPNTLGTPCQRPTWDCPSYAADCQV